MRMKKFSVILAILAVLGAGLATGAPAATEVEGDVYAGIFDKYLWRGFDLSGGEPVSQFGADLSAHGFTLSYWSNLQLSDDEAEGWESGNITETDIVLDYTFSPTDMLSVSVGNIFYQLDGIEDTNELYLGVNLDTLLAPALFVYWDYDEAKEDGYYVTASVEHTFEVTEELGINLSGLISYNGASDYSIGDYHDWHNYELGISADYAVIEDFYVSPSFLFSDSLSDDADDVIEDEILVGLTIAHIF